MRPSIDEVCLENAATWAKRSTCLRRSVGCVLTDHLGHMLSTGYNGVAAGLPHCNEELVRGRILAKVRVVGGKYDDRESYPNACAGAWAPPGLQLDLCEAIHAEQNALLQCHDVQEIHTCYVTHSPCITCVKLLRNTGCRRVVFRERYAHDQAAQALWIKEPKGDFIEPREWKHLPRTFPMPSAQDLKDPPLA